MGWEPQRFSRATNEGAIRPVEAASSTPWEIMPTNLLLPRLNFSGLEANRGCVWPVAPGRPSPSPAEPRPSGPETSIALF